MERLENYIRSGSPLIIINTVEIDRCIKSISQTVDKINRSLSSTTLNISSVLRQYGYRLFVWDINRGWHPYEKNEVDTNTMNPRNCLKYPINPDSAVGIYILRNFNLFWDDPMLKPVIIQDLQEIAEIKIPYKHIIVVGNIEHVPSDIQHLFNWLDFSLPTREELIEYTKEFDSIIKLTDSERDNIADAASGMTMHEFDMAIRSNIVKNKGKSIDIKYIFAEKAKSVRKSGFLDYMEIEETISDIGGLENLKSTLKQMAKVFINRKEAEKYRLPIPRGILLCGVSGTGKSLTAKVIANEFNIPLYRWDIGKLFDGLVGSTERNTREVFRLIEALSPAVFYIDEIEKSLSGLDSSNFSDSGVTARVIGAFLTFMQETEAPAFFVATANKVVGLAPELLRRFNGGVWFVDLPSEKEREEIFKIHIRKTGRNISDYKIKDLVKATAGYTGSEIETAIHEAMLSAFYADREYTTKDILSAIENMPKIADTKAEEINRLRTWAKGRAKIANIRDGVLPAWWNNKSDLIIEQI